MKKILGGVLAVIGAAAIITVGVEVVKRFNNNKEGLEVGAAKLEDVFSEEVDADVLPEGFDEDEAAEKLEEQGVVAPLQGTPFENEDNTPNSQIKTEEGEENENMGKDINDIG